MAAVVEVTVMSPLAVTVRTLPDENPTAASVMAFADVPVTRAMRSYGPIGTGVSAPALLYATEPPTGTSAPEVVFFAYRVIGLEFEIAFTNRT